MPQLLAHLAEFVGAEHREADLAPARGSPAGGGSGAQHVARDAPRGRLLACEQLGLQLAPRLVEAPIGDQRADRSPPGVISIISRHLFALVARAVPDLARIATTR